MALKGLDIFKLSPKKNCKECGSPTCMAFCMKVAQGAVSLDKCPYFSEEALATLNSATAPLMKTITVGDYKLGGETVHVACFGSCASINRSIITDRLDTSYFCTDTDSGRRVFAWTY